MTGAKSGPFSLIAVTETVSQIPV